MTIFIPFVALALQTKSTGAVGGYNRHPGAQWVKTGRVVSYYHFKEAVFARNELYFLKYGNAEGIKSVLFDSAKSRTMYTFKSLS